MKTREHFPRNTVSAAFYCKKCGAETQHAIGGGRKGACLACLARLSNQSRASARVNKRYVGTAGGTVNVFTSTATGWGAGQPLALRLDLADHSPTGFAWGYGGSGPAQLALAILADCLGDEQRALALYQPFKFEVIAALDGCANFVITSERIREWVDGQAGDLFPDRRRA